MTGTSTIARVWSSVLRPLLVLGAVASAAALSSACDRSDQGKPASSAAGAAKASPADPLRQRGVGEPTARR